MVEGYSESTYGDRFADVYDAWYGDDTDDSDTEAAVARLADLAGPVGPPVVELGVGTGRLALPLARMGHAVTGIDASEAMLAALAAKPDGHTVTAVLAGMAEPLAVTDASLVFVARNTLFNLTTEADQRQCFAAAAAALAPDGWFVVEAFVPDGSRQLSSVAVRDVGVDRVVLFVDRHDPDTQEAWSSFVEMTPSGNRFRPCHIRYATPAQLDAMAQAAGLELHERHEDWTGRPFGADSATHVSVYRRNGWAGRVDAP